MWQIIEYKINENISISNKVGNWWQINIEQVKWARVSNANGQYGVPIYDFSVGWTYTAVLLLVDCSMWRY